MWEFVLYQNAPRPGSWQAEGLTEGEQLAALGSSELFPFRLLITFAATTLVGIWSSCFAAACNTPYSARFSPRCIAHRTRSTPQCHRPTWWLEARKEMYISNTTKTNSTLLGAACFCGIRQLPIFPGRRQPSIVGVQGLNFCVRDGNRWNPLA